jgi:hypothetical protein
MKKFLQSCAFCLIILSSSVSVAAEITTVCINGYMFAVYTTSYGVSMVQIFQQGNGGSNSYPPQPIRCK